MWTYEFSRSTDLPPGRLWAVLIDITAWSQLDSTIEAIEMTQTARVGSKFRLQNKTGHWSTNRIEACHPPSRLSYVTPLPLGKLKTTYSLFRKARGTDIAIDVQLDGPLWFYWRHRLGRQYPEQILLFANALIERARGAQPKVAVPAPHFDSVTAPELEPN